MPGSVLAFYTGARDDAPGSTCTAQPMWPTAGVRDVGGYMKVNSRTRPFTAAEEKQVRARWLNAPCLGPTVGSDDMIAIADRLLVIGQRFVATLDAERATEGHKKAA